MVLGGRAVIMTCASMFIVFMVVAIETQQLPVAAIGRIIVVIMVFMMDRKFAESFS